MNDDIVSQPRPVSKHPKMSREQRAKQFMPFAALGNMDSRFASTKIDESRQIIDFLS